MDITRMRGARWMVPLNYRAERALNIEVLKKGFISQDILNG